ncbi:MAG: alpha/beta fold hydrolase, partial [Flavobacteriales bacterium]
MTTETFTHGSLTLTYGIRGAGSEVILAFHGFGQSPDVWERWSTAIPASKYMLSIGLFGHGTSSFPLSRMKKRPLEKAEWSELIAALLESRGIHQVEIWAYSMGSRMAMSFIERYPERVRRMTLFAPDGLKRNLLYRFACETALGRWLFDQGLRHDQVLIGLIAMLSRMRFMPHRL